VFNVETKTISATHDVYIALCLPRQFSNKNAQSTIQHRWNRRTVASGSAQWG
jgi:hypothetical protein